MIGDTITDRHLVLVVVWDGACGLSLLSNVSRPSPLADLVKDKRMPKGKRKYDNVWRRRLKVKF